MRHIEGARMDPLNATPFRSDRAGRRRPAILRVAAAALVAGVLMTGVPGSRFMPTLRAQGCGLRYVATGDDIPAGHDVSNSQRYADHLFNDHLKKWGAWCEYDIAQNGTTSPTEISGGQLAQTWNYRPDLITLTIGE